MADTETTEESLSSDLQLQASVDDCDEKETTTPDENAEVEPETGNEDSEPLSTASTPGDTYKIVAAIDFGTTFSGYAYSFSDDKEKIYTNKNWGQTQGFLLHKTPTCLLLRPDGEFEAFGFEAVSKYNDLTEEEADEYYYFDRFKMKLFDNKDLHTDILLEDAKGKQQLAVDMFAKSLRFMKDHLMRAMKTNLEYDPDPQSIRWVLTVPAIWDENAKQFMREAAHRGDLIETVYSNQLVIALEPEAASLHCRTLPMSTFMSSGDSLTKPSFEPGTKYLVVDAGGGTIDIVAHKIRKDGRIRELFRATGGAWGGTVIDNQFINLLTKIFGEDFISAFQNEFPKDFVELLQDFEIKKRGECESIRVSLPYNFCNYKHFGRSVQECIKLFAAEAEAEIKFSSGKLVMSAAVVNELFQDALSQINDHMKTLMQKSKMKDIKYIFLVGGFAESSRLQRSIKDEFSSETVSVLIPEEASLAVVRGAVDFGRDPSSICQRICRFTYGVGSYLPFKDGDHREDLKVESDGMVLCKNILQVWAEAGEVIGHNEIWKESYTPIITNQKGIIFEFYKSSKKKVKYTDEGGVTKCGCLVVEMPDMTGDKTRSVDLEVIFGGTEIKVVGYDHTSNTTRETYIDFLTV